MIPVIGITGLARSGKSTVAQVLVDYGFLEVGFADPIKRSVKAWWPGFRDQALWGPSELRSERPSGLPGPTARQACRHVGTDVARALDPDVWVRNFLDTVLAIERGWFYTREEGISSGSRWLPRGIVAPDLRYNNEAVALRDRGFEVWRVVRPGVERASDHVSEAGVSEELLTMTILNAGSLEGLRTAVDVVLTSVGVSR